MRDLSPYEVTAWRLWPFVLNRRTSEQASEWWLSLSVKLPWLEKRHVFDSLAPKARPRFFFRIYFLFDSICHSKKHMHVGPEFTMRIEPRKK